MTTLDKHSLDVLKNFCDINNTLLVRPGNQLVTTNTTQTLYASAIVSADFPRQFAVADLKRLIGILSMFDEPTLTFEDNYLRVESRSQVGKNSRYVDYTYADMAAVIPKPPEKLPKVENPDVTFTMPSKMFDSLLKASSILTLPDIAVIADGKTLKVQAAKPQGSTDSFSEALGKTDKKFKLVFNVDKLSSLLTRDYQVEMSSKGIAHFSFESKLEYWFGVDKTKSKVG